LGNARVGVEAEASTLAFGFTVDKISARDPNHPNFISIKGMSSKLESKKTTYTQTVQRKPASDFAEVTSLSKPVP
jgi:hypothetical protein